MYFSPHQPDDLEVVQMMRKVPIFFFILKRLNRAKSEIKITKRHTIKTDKVQPDFNIK